MVIWNDAGGGVLLDIVLVDSMVVDVYTAGV